jgi:sugar lactone lactonase YvrE
MTAQHRSTVLASLAASLLVSACQVAATPATPPPTGASSNSTPATASTSAAESQSALSNCPKPQALTSLTVLARTDISPDDLLALADGTMWVSDPDHGHIEHLAADGHVLTRIADELEPEGMVAVGRDVVLAEQATNQLVRFTPPDTTRSTVLTLPSRGAAEGIDGIGIDPTGARLLIPDSAHGTLLSAATDGSATRTLATGLGRDVAAAVGLDGAIWVAVEGKRGLLRVPPEGGTATGVGGSDVTQLDDVVAVGQLLYATSITTNAVVAIDAATGADRVLVTGGHSLQGLALLPDGRLAIADSTSRVIAMLVPCLPA